MPIIYPRNDLTYAENLLYMMHAVPCEPYKVGCNVCVCIYIQYICYYSIFVNVMYRMWLRGAVRTCCT